MSHNDEHRGLHRSIGDRPRHCQYSTVEMLSVTNVGWNGSLNASVATAGNSNPPQFFVEQADPTPGNLDFKLRCPRGNPNKMWALFTSTQGNVATVANFDNVDDPVDPHIIISMRDELVDATRIRGMICYGRSARGGDGAVAPPPSHVKPLASFSRYEVQGLLPQIMMAPVAWQVDGGAGDVSQFRAPIGWTVEHTDVGEYTVVTDNTFRFWNENWADMIAASDGRAISVNVSGQSAGIAHRFVITFDDDTDMADGDTAGLIMVGPVSKQPRNYGGEAGGVSSDLKARDIHNYSQYDHGSPYRDSCFLPFHLSMNGGAIVEAESNIPPGMRVSASGGDLTLYIGSIPTNAIIAAVNSPLVGTTFGVSAVDEEAGTVTITADGGFPPGGSLYTLNGLIIALTQNVA